MSNIGKYVKVYRKEDNTDGIFVDEVHGSYTDDIENVSDNYYDTDSSNEFYIGEIIGENSDYYLIHIGNLKLPYRKILDSLEVLGKKNPYEKPKKPKNSLNTLFDFDYE